MQCAKFWNVRSPEVRLLLTSALVAHARNPKAFSSERNLAAWFALMPKQNSRGGKERLGRVTKQGDWTCAMLTVGALAVIRYAQRHVTRRPWLLQLLARRAAKVATVALTN